VDKSVVNSVSWHKGVVAQKCAVAQWGGC